MKAIAYTRSLPIDDLNALLDVELPDPDQPTGHDLLVEVSAVSVNPVDTKVRRRVDPGGAFKVLGYDAAGIVRAVGDAVTRFRPGDEVFYAGSIERPGTNAELHLVDERIVGPKPRSLSFTEAAALPLTAITAWEALFHRLAVPRDTVDGAVLVIGGAGGVGSIALQLARQLTALHVVGTASRPETVAWCERMGAHAVLDHAGDLVAQARALDVPVRAVLATNATDRHWPAIAELIAPQGRICLIDDPEAIDVRLLKRKSASLHWEFMFTRPIFGTADMSAQGELLAEVARLVDADTLRTTATEHRGALSAANLRKAHALVESGTVRGKVVLDRFE
jgi:NADPH2:quinone reductase